jgi:hypothetical protein
MEIRNVFYFAFIPLWLVGLKTETWKRRLLDGKCGKADSAKKEEKQGEKKKSKQCISSYLVRNTQLLFQHNNTFPQCKTTAFDIHAQACRILKR